MTFLPLGKQTKAYSVLNAALELSEGWRNNTIPPGQSHSEFLRQKKFVEAGISINECSFSQAVRSTKPEWQDKAKEFRQTGKLPADMNNRHRKHIMRFAVEVFDRQNSRMMEQRQREETDIGAGNSNTNTTAAGNEERPDSPPALPPILPDLKTMAASMVSVANELDAYQKQFDMVYNALESECGKNEQLTKEKEALKELNDALEAHSNEARDQMEKDYQDLQAKLEAECEERLKRKALYSEEKRYLEEFHRASAAFQEPAKKRKRLNLQNAEQRAIVDAATQLTTEEKRHHICVSKASVSLMHENMDLRNKYDELDGKYQENEKTLMHENMDLRKEYDELDGKYQENEKTLMHQNMDLRKKYNELDGKYQENEKKLLLQVSLCKKERKKRKSLADELEQVQRRLSQLQGSVARSEATYMPAADCYDINI
jgi:hypothetical protein